MLDHKVIKHMILTARSKIILRQKKAISQNSAFYSLKKKHFYFNMKPNEHCVFANHCDEGWKAENCSYVETLPKYYMQIK